MTKALIGVFDSGVGGLSVLREIHAQLPQRPTLYLADQAHVPYGSREKSAVLDYARGITEFLLEEGADLIVLACNTASAAALHTLRDEYPQTEFVGMEPAVKPAAEHSQSGVVGVLATPSTFESELYASVLARFAQGATILKSTCAGLVEEIEAGRAEGHTAREILNQALAPMLARGLDSVVLGCTHYPFAMDLIREIVGAEIEIFDPAPAIARRVASLLEEANEEAKAPEAGSRRIVTTGESQALAQWLQASFPEWDASVHQIKWSGGKLS